MMLHAIKRTARTLGLLMQKISKKGLQINCRASNVSLQTELSIQGDGKLVVQDHLSTIGKTTISTSGLVEIGSVALNRYDVIVCMNHIKIGKDCRFGPMVMIYDHDHKFGADGTETGYSTGEVVIGDHVWIGANCAILRDTYIGDNCVIGAGCVVQGVIPAHSLVTMNRDLIITPLRDPSEAENETVGQEQRQDKEKHS